METLAEILVVICILAICLCIRMLIRNNRVANFRRYVLRLENLYNDELIADGHGFNNFYIFHSLPEYDEMLWSTKKLTLENYLNESQVEALNKYK